MGMHVESGSEDRAPKFFFNHCGYLLWGGKSASELTAGETYEMREFIESEAYRDGFRSAKEPNRPQWNPFDKKFLFGEPFRLWEKCFLIGMLHGSNTESGWCPESPIFWTSTEICIVNSLITSCEALAGEFEESFRRFGAVHQSAFRYLAVAMLGWGGYTCSAGYDGEAHYALAFSDREAWLATFDEQGRYRDSVTGYWSSQNGECFCEERNAWVSDDYDYQA